MRLAAFEAVATALDREKVRYLVAGGLAVNARGYIRLTMDIDIVIALDGENIHRAFRALSQLGYRPTVPIDVEDFAQSDQREKWRKEKGMQVLNLQSDRFLGSSVNISVYEPFDFSSEYESAMIGELLPDLPVRFVSIPTLIEMKASAARPRDLDDIEHLKRLQDANGHG